tara:strand:+ start:1115 stop:1645 length:531 start_codon:yes stop_codon:yes gene_type:complete
MGKIDNCIHDQIARMKQLNKHIVKKFESECHESKNLDKILVKKLTKDAKIPTKSNPSDAGFDLYATEDNIIHPGEKAKIKTGISMAIPEGCAGLIWPRSGSALKFGIDTLAGVIDSDYRGEICVILQNHGKLPYVITHGDRVAQLLINKIPAFEMIPTETLDTTTRGSDGFGSTGA